MTDIPQADPRGLLVVGGVVVLSGEALDAVLRAVLIVARQRKLNGLPAGATWTNLADALVAARGHVDVPDTVVLPPSDVTTPTVTIETAAHTLNLSRRQTRRLAPKLGGRIIAGRWLLDHQAIHDHLTGKASQ